MGFQYDWNCGGGGSGVRPAGVALCGAPPLGFVFFYLLQSSFRTRPIALFSPEHPITSVCSVELGVPEDAKSAMCSSAMQETV